MATPFSGDCKIATRLSPLLAMGQNASPTRAKLSEKMGQLVAQSAIDFARVL